MIVFGGNNCIQNVYDDITSRVPKWSILNYFNTVMLGKPISAMFPPRLLQEAYMSGNIDRITFDQSFAKYIIEEDIPFLSFMEITMSEYVNDKTFILFDDSNEFLYSLVETIIALIRERYHLNTSIIGDWSDIRWIEQSYMDEFGNAMFENDKSRYLALRMRE